MEINRYRVLYNTKMLRFETFAELSRYINAKENRSLIQRMRDVILRGLYYIRVSNEHLRMYVVVIGDYGVGKSSLVLKYVSGHTMKYQEPREVILVCRKVQQIFDAVVDLTIIEIPSGNDNMQFLETADFQRYISGYVVVYSMQNISTFNTVQTLISEIRRRSTVDILLLANKKDEAIIEQLSTDGLSVARRYVNIQFKEVSAVEETGAVKNEFTFFLKTILDRMRLPRASPQTVRTFRFQDEPNLIPRPSSA